MMEMRDFPGVQISMTPAPDSATIFGIYSTIRGTTTADIDAATAEVLAWVQDQFGDEGWKNIFSTFIIEDPVKATAFRVRWC